MRFTDLSTLDKAVDVLGGGSRDADALTLQVPGDGGVRSNGFSIPLQFLPFISSAFLPTDLMSPGVAWFAEHQPFTPVIDTLRALLNGTPVGDSAWLAIGWCAPATVGGYLWSRKLYNRDPSR